MTEQEILNQRITDIQEISFADSVTEITSSLSIVLTLYEIDDEPHIIGACKQKLLEGFTKKPALGLVFLLWK